MVLVSVSSQPPTFIERKGDVYQMYTRYNYEGSSFCLPVELFLLYRTVGVLNDLLRSIITVFCLVTHKQLEVSFTYTASEVVCLMSKSSNLWGFIEPRVRQLKNLHRVLRL